MNESVAAQMLKRGMRLGAWAISKGMQEDLTLLKHRKGITCYA